MFDVFAWKTTEIINRLTEFKNINIIYILLQGYYGASMFVIFYIQVISF